MLAAADLINAAASTALLVHNMQSVCFREYMRNSLQYNLRNVCSIRLVCVVRMQFAVTQQMPSREAHERVGLITSKVWPPRHILGMLQLLLAEAVRHARYTSDTIKIHLTYVCLINKNAHDRKGMKSVGTSLSWSKKESKFLINMFPRASKEKLHSLGLHRANRKKGSGMLNTVLCSAIELLD